MGVEKSEQVGAKKVFRLDILREIFYIFTLNLLSLLLPLSFLLLSRLSKAQYVFTSQSGESSFLLSLFLYTNPTLLHILVLFVSVTALLVGLTGEFSTLHGLNNGASGVIPVTTSTRIMEPKLYTAWILLCTLQVCVGLGIEGTIAAGIWNLEYDFEYDVPNENYMFIVRFFFLVGLLETMLHWSRTFVRPVVDDTVFGRAKGEERWWVERLVMGASFGVLWWWRLRDEVEGLVVVVETKRGLEMGLGISDFVSWWLYYLTVTIGVVRLARGLLWFGKVMFVRRRIEVCDGCSCGSDDKV
ncbi:hypothetical protein ACHQM5_018425 [Ranunculus cassubicifolius]